VSVERFVKPARLSEVWSSTRRGGSVLFQMWRSFRDHSWTFRYNSSTNGLARTEAPVEGSEES
jgi:hypothetical protein